jgi:hypothetical protein
MYTDGHLARTEKEGAHVLGRYLTDSCAILQERFFTLRLLAYLKFLFINPLTPELNLSAQRCLMRFFTGNFAS